MSAIDILPGVVTGYLAAHQARDMDKAGACFVPDALVRDDGHTHRGTDEIRDWLARGNGEYRWTATLTGATRIDDSRYEARQHIEGDFPGGVVDLRFRFTLRDGLVSELVIEP
jgi:hypothetical protein